MRKFLICLIPCLAFTTNALADVNSEAKKICQAASTKSKACQSACRSWGAGAKKSADVIATCNPAPAPVVKKKPVTRPKKVKAAPAPAPAPVVEVSGGLSFWEVLGMLGLYGLIAHLLIPFLIRRRKKTLTLEQVTEMLKQLGMGLSETPILPDDAPEFSSQEELIEYLKTRTLVKFD